MGDDITIGVTEIVNNIEVTAQPNDQVVDINVTDNADEVTLNITPTVIEINVNKGSSYARWGSIIGNLTDQVDLTNALFNKADLVDGKVPSYQLPSFVDDVIEVANFAALPTVGETGKIYITLDNNKIYRWSGSIYIEIASNQAIWGAITGSLASQTDLVNALNLRVPYTGATQDVNLGVHTLLAQDLVINHSSGSGVAASITKNGSGEALTVIKGSGSGNAASITGGVTLLSELHLTTDLADDYIASAAIWNAKQNALNGTGFVKVVGTTVSYDNSTYALDSVVVKLTGNQSIAGWKTFTGGLTLWDNPLNNLLSFNVSGIEVGSISVGSSFFQFKAINSFGYLFKNSAGSNVLTITDSGASTFSSSLTANSFIKSGGTSSQFLKADGSLDSTVYTPASRTLTINGVTQDLSANRSFTVATHDAVTIGTANGLSLSGQALSLGLASGSTTGALSSTDWTTFNNKQNTITNPITGSGTINFLPKFTQSGSIGNSQIFDNGSFVGIGVSTGLNRILQVVGSTPISHKHTSSPLEMIIGQFDSSGNAIINNTANAILGINTNNQRAITILPNLNVGIGTTSPSELLDVNGRARFSGRLGVSLSSSGVNFNNSSFYVNNTSNLKGAIFGYDDTNDRFYFTSLQYGVQYKPIIFSASTTIFDGGNVIIGNLGTGLVYSNAGTLTSTNPSDERLKYDITDLQYGLKEILQLRPVSYNWKNDTINQGKQFGFIAQEVQEIMPELISEFTTIEDEEEVVRLGLDKEGIYATLVNAIKEQQVQIDLLKLQIEMLKQN